jgi:hypothetical protein
MQGLLFMFDNIWMYQYHKTNYTGLIKQIF